MNTRWRLFVVAGIWTVAVTCGMAMLLDYSTTPGRPGAPPSAWPSDSSLDARGDLPSLVLTIHPRCPCSRASLEELARLMARCRGLLRVHVLFFKPAGAPDGWSRTDLWASATAMPGVDVRIDEDGSEARRFGVETSGLVFGCALVGPAPAAGHGGA